MPKRRKDDPGGKLEGIGSRIKSARRRHGITQSELAERLGISHQQISKYERNADDISAVRLKHIAEVLDTPVGSLYTTVERGLADTAQEGYRTGAEDEFGTLVGQLRTTVAALEKLVRAQRK